MLYWIGCGLDLAGVWGLVRRSHGDIEVIVPHCVEVSAVVNTIGKLPSNIVLRISVLNLRRSGSFLVNLTPLGCFITSLPFCLLTFLPSLPP